MTKCEKCGKKIRSLFPSVYTDNERNQFYCCDDCYKKEKEKEIKREEKKYVGLSQNERIIQEQIEELEGNSGVVVILLILGIIGLFVYGAGIILLIAAAIVYSSRKSRAASLRAQLESIKQSKQVNKKVKSPVSENPLDILKKRFAEGKITEEEYNKKKSILEQ